MIDDVVTPKAFWQWGGQEDNAFAVSNTGMLRRHENQGGIGLKLLEPEPWAHFIAVGADAHLR